MKRLTCMAITIFAASMSSLPGMAQNEISNNQPITRSLSADEIRIEAKLKADFKKGLIDSNQLSSFQRDLDGILVKEDSFKSRGLTDDGRASIGKSLCEFEARLDKSAGVVTTAAAENKTGPKADENNGMLDKIAPTK